MTTDARRVIHTDTQTDRVLIMHRTGRRSFPVAASMFWNTLPDDIQSAPSVSAFRRLLKTLLFQHSFPDVIP